MTYDEMMKLLPEGHKNPMLVDPRNVPALIVTTADLVNKVAKLVANEGDVNMSMLRDAIAKQDAALVPWRDPAE